MYHFSMKEKCSLVAFCLRMYTWMRQNFLLNLFFFAFSSPLHFVSLHRLFFYNFSVLFRHVPLFLVSFIVFLLSLYTLQSFFNF